MQLDNELRTIKLGSLSITEYFYKINHIADLLANIDSPVDEKNFVIYAINGLSDKPTKMGYALQPGNIPHIPQATSNWTSPTTYHSTATTFSSRGILGPAPRQAHVTQPTIPLDPTGPDGVSPSGPPAYTTCPLYGTWGP
nr:hybrid signal transduction histidine kinase M [Tanacetum cinerariifolium]